MNPSSAISRTISRGTSPFWSISAASGSRRSRAQSRAVRCASCCSSVSERSNAAGGAAGGVMGRGGEPALGLPPEPAGGDVARQQRRGPVLVVAEVAVEDLEDREADVEADQVGQRERAKGMTQAEAHDRVDPFG